MGITGLHCLFLSERQALGWRQEERALGRALPVLTYQLWDLEGDAATGDQNGREENGNKYWGSQESVSKSCQVRFPQKLTETMFLEGTSFRAPPHRPIWDGDPSNSPSQNEMPALPGKYEADVLGSQQGALLFALHIPPADI